DPIHHREIRRHRLGAAIGQQFFKARFLGLFLPALSCGVEILAEFLVSNERLRGHDALVPQVADRCRAMSVLEVNKLPIRRKEITWFEARATHACWIELYLIHIQQILLPVEFRDELTLVSLAS